MKIVIPILLGIALAFAAPAELAVLPMEPEAVFGGSAAKINITCRNAGGELASADVGVRIFQTTSATAVLWRETPLKRMQALPGQTVLENAEINFPTVAAPTRFLLKWLEDRNRIVGETEVEVYPTNLLAELALLGRSFPDAPSDKTVLGIFDPQNQLKPLLKNFNIAFEDLESSGIEKFSGKLAVIGPFQSKTHAPENLADEIERIAKRNVAVVWIRPQRARDEKPVPSFFSVRKGRTAVVVVQPDLVSDLAANPRSQLNLIYFCKLSLNPKPPVLPDVSP